MRERPIRWVVGRTGSKERARGGGTDDVRSGCTTKGPAHCDHWQATRRYRLGRPEPPWPAGHALRRPGRRRRPGRQSAGSGRRGGPLRSRQPGRLFDRRLQLPAGSPRSGGAAHGRCRRRDGSGLPGAPGSRTVPRRWNQPGGPVHQCGGDHRLDQVLPPPGLRGRRRAAVRGRARYRPRRAQSAGWPPRACVTDRSRRPTRTARSAG